jgi:hypothetical protein
LHESAAFEMNKSLKRSIVMFGLLALGMSVSYVFTPLTANAESVALDTFCGLDDTNPAASLPQCQAQDALNVESSLSGNAILKRSGYSRLFSLTVATSPVSGSFSFVDVNGSRQDVVCHDHYCSKSTNGASFTVFLSTAGGVCVPKRWSFVQISGRLYGANDCRDAIFQYDGTTFSSPLTMPAGAVLELTKDRLVVADVTSNPNGVYYSQSGTYTNFTTGVNSVDPYIDSMGSPGDRVSALKYALGRLYIFKTTSITTCILGDQYSSKCFPVSNIIGTQEPLSIVEVSDGIYFRGQDRNYWRLDDSGLTIVSKKISRLLALQGSGSVQSNTQTSQTDWQSGTQAPSGSWNTTASPGSISNGSYTVLTSAISSTTFAMVDIDTTAYVLRNIDNFDRRNTDGWSVTTGSASANNYFVEIGTFDAVPPAGSYTLVMSTTVDASTGTWSYIFKSSAPPAQATALEFWFAYSSATVYAGTPNTRGTGHLISLNNSGTNNVRLYTVSHGAITRVVNAAASGAFDGNWHTMAVTRSTNGFMSAWLDGVLKATDTSIGLSTGTNVVIGFQIFNAANQSQMGIDSIKFPSLYINQASTAYDGASTTIPGGYSLTVTTGLVTTQVESSYNGSTWSGMTDIVSGSTPTTRGRYWRDRFITLPPQSASTLVPRASSYMLVVTTGQFTTQCIQPGSAISSWGLLSCAETAVGNGSLVLYATSAVSCALLPTSAPSAWQNSVTNNTTLPISVSSAVYIGFRSLLGAATDQAQVDSCTLYWNNGNAAPPVWGTYDSFKNSIYWTAAINNSASNNRVLKYDLNLDQWYPFDLAANAIRYTQGTMYFGDSTGGYWNQYGSVNSDNGASITAYWKSKDWGGGTPFLDKQFKALSLVTKNQGAGTLDLTYGLSNGESKSYSVSLSSSTNLTYVHANVNLPLLSPTQFMNVQIGNASAVPFEVDGLQIDFESFPWRPQNP